MMIQVSHAHPTVLRDVRRAAALAARLASAYAPERATAYEEFMRVVRRSRVVHGQLIVPAHSCRGCAEFGEVLVIGGSSVPWWRGYLALALAQHHGFRHEGGPRSRPWRLDGESLVLDLFGDHSSVESARVRFALAEVMVMAVAIRGVSRVQLDEFLAGLAMGVAHDLDDERQRSASRRAMVAYVPLGEAVDAPSRSALDDYLDVAVVDASHPLSRGFVLAKRMRLAREVLK